MKKIIVFIMIASLSLTSLPKLSMAVTPAHTTAASALAEAPASVNILTSRLDEIKNTDKSNLTSSEKRGLRKEVRSIRQQLREIGGGVYISVGAIILIVILLILFL